MSNAQLVLAEEQPSGLSLLFEGTPEERRACVKDVQRHCREMMPDTFRVLSCLQQNRTKISKPCLAVLESHGQ
ncbi:MAG TPA: cysteine rich repeat-containing protein [Xanthobacteraceae bacterium]|nr:cysteine rich repeat-containing protein [Xanthobacteraceae bacterium]